MPKSSSARDDPPASSAADTIHPRAEEKHGHNEDDDENDCTSNPSNPSLQSRERAHPHSSSPSSSNMLGLPRMITVTVPKRVDQPAGLKLQIRVSEKRSNKKLRQRSNNKSGKSGGSVNSSSNSRSSSGRSTSVVITSISRQSPFHPDNIVPAINKSNTNTANYNANNDATDDITDDNSTTTLRKGDEILTINGHRVKDPKRAVQMIKAATSGYLTIVASRGRERMELEGTPVYHLARLEHDLNVENNNCGVEFRAATNNNNSNSNPLVRVSNIAKDQSPFARTGLKEGDIVLTIDGNVVRSASDAQRLLTTEDPTNKDNNNNQDGNVRVVALLVHSFWDMRTRVLREELKMDTEGDESGGNAQLWEVSWSYEQDNDQLQTKDRIEERATDEEFVTLQIPSTTVMFRLNFDEDGTCSCRDPHAALHSFLAERRRRQGANRNHHDRKQRQYDHSYSHVVDDEEDSRSTDSQSRLSQDEKCAALDLLFRKHVQPAIEALNLQTRKQIRLLANALAATNDSRTTPADEQRTASVRSSQSHQFDAATHATNNGPREKVVRAGASEHSPLVGDSKSEQAEEHKTFTMSLQPSQFERPLATNNHGVGEKVVRSAVRERRDFSPPIDDFEAMWAKEQRTATSNNRSPRTHQLENAQATKTHGVEGKIAQAGVRDHHRSSPPPVDDFEAVWAKEQKTATIRRNAPRPDQLGNAPASKNKGVGENNVRAGDHRSSSPPVDEHESTQMEEPGMKSNRSPQPYQMVDAQIKPDAGRERKISRRTRSPRPYQMENAPVDEHGSTQMEERGVKSNRSPQPYQMVETQIKPDAVEERRTFRRRRSSRPYQMENAQISADKLVEEPSKGADLDGFQAQLGKVRLHPRQEIERAVVQQNRKKGSNGTQIKSRTRTQNGLKKPPQILPAPHVVTSSNYLNPRLRRRPSSLHIPEGFPSKRASNQTELSALSGSDSSKSGTSTTSSNGSSSSSNSESSSDGEKGASHPRPSQAQASRPGQRRLSRGLSDSTELVLYSPKQAARGREKGSHGPGNESSKPDHRLSSMPKVKILNGDIRSRYKVSPRILGTGSFGIVRSCAHRATKEKLAVKSISKKDKVIKKNTTLLKNEIALIQRVNHPNVVRVVDVIQDREYIHIVMEECKGGDLFDKIVDGGLRLEEWRACEIIGSLMGAVAYLHNRNIVHRDLKAEHIMLSNSDINSSPVKIIDFGLATTHDPRRDPPMTAFAGSAFTVAPEVVKRSYGKECDLWSIGVIAYFLLTQKMPFNAKLDKEIFQKIVSGNYGFPQWTKTGLSEEAKDFVDRLLVVNPKNRMTAKQAISHLWIRKHNDATLMNSIDSLERALVPVVEEKAIVVRRQPRESTEQRGTKRVERNRQRRHDGSRPTGSAMDRRNPRRNSKPDNATGGGGVASARRPPRRIVGRDP